MAKFLKIVGIGCGGCLTLIIALSLFGYSKLDSTMYVEQSLVIDAPIEVLFPLVDSLQSWNEWDPWSELDPKMTTSFEGPPAGVGSIRRWTSLDPMVGNGWIEITDSVIGQRIELDVHMPEAEMVVNAVFDFEETDSGVLVTWTDTADLNGVFQHLFGGVANDYVLGPMLKGGLRNLSRVAKKRVATLSIPEMNGEGENSAEQSE